LPAVRVDGRIGWEVTGSAKPDDRWLREAQQRAGSMAAHSIPDFSGALDVPAKDAGVQDGERAFLQMTAGGRIPFTGPLGQP